MELLRKGKVTTARVIVLDIETVREKETFGELDENARLAFRYKTKNNGVIPDDREVAQIYAETASFYAEFSKVCSIGVVFKSKDGSKLLSQSFTGTDEVILLTSFSELLDRIYKSDPEYRLAGHNSLNFDFPYLLKRYIYNGLPIPLLLDETFKKPWERKNLCTLDLLKVGSYSGGTSLVAAAVACKLEIPKDEMAGEDVAKYYFAGELLKIDKYVTKDCVTCYNLLAVMLREKTYLFSEVHQIPSVTAVAVEEAQVVASIPIKTVAPVKAVVAPVAKTAPVVAEPATPVTSNNVVAPEGLLQIVPPTDGIAAPVGPPPPFVPETEEEVSAEEVPGAVVSFDDQFEAMPVMNQLYTSKDFSDEAQEEIRDRFLNRGKKCMKKDFKMLKEMLTRLYIQTAMFKADKPADAKLKEQEVAEFVAELEKEYYANKTK